MLKITRDMLPLFDHDRIQTRRDRRQTIHRLEHTPSAVDLRTNKGHLAIRTKLKLYGTQNNLHAYLNGLNAAT